MLEVHRRYGKSGDITATGEAVWSYSMNKATCAARLQTGLSLSPIMAALCTVSMPIPANRTGRTLWAGRSVQLALVADGGVLRVSDSCSAAEWKIDCTITAEPVSVGHPGANDNHQNPPTPPPTLFLRPRFCGDLPHFCHTVFLSQLHFDLGVESRASLPIHQKSIGC